MRPVYNLIESILDVDGIAVSQRTTGPTNLILNGVLVKEGIARLNNVAQVVDLGSLGNLAAINFTVTGRNADGRIVFETIAGPNIGTVSTTTKFTTVTKISVDALVPVGVEAGIILRSSFTSTPIMLDTRPPGKAVRGTQTVEMSQGAIFTYSVQFTSSNMQDPTVTPVWIDTDNINLISQSATSTGNFSFPIVATRLNVTGYIGGIANFINIPDG